MNFKILSKSTELARFFVSFGVAIIAGIQLRAFLLWRPDELARHGLIIDDGYFYSVIARNFQNYGFLTFDGILTTNGVQPFWMFLQAILRMLFPDSDGVIILAWSSWICYVSFTFLVIWYFNKDLCIATLLGTIIIAALTLLQPYFQHAVIRGLEAPLMLMILMLTLIAIDNVSVNSENKKIKLINNKIIVLAFLTSFLFLSRTDLFWAPVIVFLWLFTKEKRFTAKLSIFTSIVSLLVVPYLVFNFLSEQSLMPISGRVKLFYLNSFFPCIECYLNSDEWRGPYHIFDSIFHLKTFLPIHQMARYLLIFSVLFAALVIVWRNRSSNFVPRSIKFFAVIISLHLFYMHLSYRELRPYTAYYFLPEVLFVVFVAAFGVKNYFIQSTTRINIPLQKIPNYGGLKYLYMLLILISVSFFSIAWLKYDFKKNAYWTERLELAEDISRIVPENEKVAAFWPGLFAQFSGRLVVPMDGIIGSNEYFQRYVKTGREIEYLFERNIRYIAIYLDRHIDELIAGDKPEINNWSMLGTLRLWENRSHVVQIHSERIIGPNGNGWYLLEIGK